MTFSLNQFGLTDQIGETMNVNPSTISVKLSKDMVGTVKAGDALKWVAAEVGDLPIMTNAVSADQTYAVVLFNAKKATYAAKDVVEVALAGSIVTMAANGAISRGALVSWNSVAAQAQSTTTNYLGYSLDIASTAGDIISVFVQPKLS